MKVTVTREDITRPIRKYQGRWGSESDINGDCPLARGLNRASPNGDFIVGLGSYIEKSSNWKHRTLPKKAEKFRSRFDRGGWFMQKYLILMAPWTFEFPELN